MEKETNCTSLIPKLYRRNYLDVALFNWIEGQRRLFRSVTIEQSIDLFAKHYGIANHNPQSMRVTYNRMQQEFIELQKSE